MSTIDSNRTIRIMGILNLTPDSFYAPSRYNMSILDSGADIIDIGAYSTRPGHRDISLEEEWDRLEPVLESIAVTHPHLQISIDTFRSEIIRRAHSILGKLMVNDVSGGDNDSAMLDTAGRLGLPYVAMHHGPADRVEDILDYFIQFTGKAAQTGINEWYADPGFGFGKNVEQNLNVLHSLDALAGISSGLLIGISRKRMTYEPEGLTPEEALDATERLHLIALENGADILRVHDIGSARKVIDLYRKRHAAH